MGIRILRGDERMKFVCEVGVEFCSGDQKERQVHMARLDGCPFYEVKGEINSKLNNLKD